MAAQWFRFWPLLPAAALLLPGWAGLVLSVLLSAAGIVLTHWLPLPQEQTAKALTIDTDVLLTGGREVEAVMAPEERSGRARINAGPSMLLLSHAALLTLPDGPEALAAERFFRSMKLDRAMLQQRMPLVETLEQDGIRWQLRRDGSRIQAFACGGVGLLAHCPRIQGTQPGPLGHQQRERLTELLSGTLFPPLCFAQAPFENGRLGAPVFLGALLLREELQPWLNEELSLLAEQGRQVMLPEEIARRLGLSQPAPAYSLLFTLKEANGEGMIQLKPGERPSAWFAAETQRHREEELALRRKPLLPLAGMLLAALWLTGCGLSAGSAMISMVPFCLIQLFRSRDASTLFFGLWAAAAVMLIVAGLLSGMSVPAGVFALAMGALMMVTVALLSK